MLADLTGIEEKTLSAMLVQHVEPAIGLHPEFGPDVGVIDDQLDAYCLGRSLTGCQ